MVVFLDLRDEGVWNSGITKEDKTANLSTDKKTA
jgi:hypothetical protein